MPYMITTLLGFKPLNLVLYWIVYSAVCFHTAIFPCTMLFAHIIAFLDFGLMSMNKSTFIRMVAA